MFTSYIKNSKSFQSLVASLGRGGQHAYAASFVQGYLLAALREEAWDARTLFVVTPDAAAAGRLAADLKAFAGGVPVWRLPSRGVMPGSGLVPSRQVTGLRHAALNALEGSAPAVVVADAVALMEKAPHAQLWPPPFEVGKGAAPEFDRLVEKLAALGYERVPQVEDRGQFAVRGGIIDVFPATDLVPLRLEYFGEALESLRRFSPFSQRSLSEEEQAILYAAAEPEGYEGDLRDALHGAPVICRIDPAAAGPLVSSFWEDSAGVLEGGAGDFYLNPEELEGRLAGVTALTLESLRSGQRHRFGASGAVFGVRGQAAAIAALKNLVAAGLSVFICFSSPGAARRAGHVLAGHAMALEPGALPPPGPGAWLVEATPPAGFISSELKLAVFGGRALLKPGRDKRRRELKAAGRAVLGFRDLGPGDFVVHRDHGIGVFEVVETRTVAGVTRDYLNLRYRDGDRLFVPQEQISLVSRYVGAGAGSPPLSKLGGRAWAQARSRARTAAREMAGELLQLYAARQGLSGHAFAPDGRWQLELESAFPFSETPDQEAAIEDVKEDMESPHPMDRLICGDVGYGKTEVALRAAFKAASEGRQVMMLVPTTILALQHFNTFRSRFSSYPVNLEMVSRFRSETRNQQLAAAFSEGKVDVLIGTHRLLSRDIVPHDLGLVIIDEEQRFGVAQKESLSQLRLKVDVLSLSATPIPRTLEMSLSGIRDISIMESPPAGRNPIRTYVGEYDDRLVARAIAAERERGGQVFFLHNRVESIEDRLDELKEQMPQARFLMAHGRMPERQLESVMVSFLAGEADVLLCTSIIESGLDIPSANTLIVERADMLGLAQLYQIRGRIGRSDVAAHAYLLYPPGAALTPEARARLATLSDYSDLGAGFRIAMRDLEIRGAGNLLGDEQSGHVAAVGFEMYCGLVRRAVAELKGTPLEEGRMVRLDTDVDAFIPADYVSSEAARIDIHHRIAAAADEQTLADIDDELKDRYGQVPVVVKNLLEMQSMRLRAAVLGASALNCRRGRLELAGLKLESGQRAAIEEAGIEFTYHPLKRILVTWPGADDGLSVVKKALNAIIDSLFSSAAKL